MFIKIKEFFVQDFELSFVEIEKERWGDGSSKTDVAMLIH